MTFYEVTVEIYNKGYPYASGYGPLASGMPFLHPATLERRKLYWEVNPEQPGLSISKEKGTKWPDFIHCGHSPPLYFVSEKVVTSLSDETLPY